MRLHNRLKLLQHYLGGKINEEQTRLVDDWYHSVDDTKPIGLWQEEGKINAIKGGIHLQILEQINTKKVVPMRGRIVAAACIISLLIGASWFFLLHHNRQSITSFTITAATGEIKQLLLPDSSKVWLKSGTTLQYSSQYGKTDRHLELLEGEAFFEVQKDDTRPFVVKSGGLETKVLGTAFNVQAYRNRPSVQVWVQQGRVQVSDSTQVLAELSKGKRLQWNTDDGRFRVDSLQWKQAQAWRDGVLLLESATFSELANELQDTYGVTLVTSDADIRSQHYDAKFFIRKTSVNDIMATLAEVHGIQYKIQGNTIILY
ncbi:ferric-dicitrate binding protein FerR, regulates iron transport through sigma-19 [Chitinophaga eiseniae]|uniref:Ferric-dicitrate binding protein FerR, regulates iron transport through sigma-19 n=1 Tax=Chitinophaga eiseniae TaxID=634771 RepID=A0A1T4KM23_9BACT|nr:FecR domain-containing protein [Chitinophaga eiseniae]SJZ43449.1 ferric-dicitrate binding protein FerR, regulates iron transport through sigma-19 [Chitinophaga eiseniae]